MFEGIYITNTKNTLIFEYLVFQHVPTFSTIASTVSTKFKDHKTHGVQIVETSQDYFICSHSTDKLVIYLLCSCREFKEGYNPLLPFVFIEKVLETMREYFGAPLSGAKITSNNDTLTLLLHQMIADGLPHVTEFNNLKDVVSSKSLLSKIMHTGNQLAAAAGNKSLTSLANNGFPDSSVETSPVPWRRAKARYTNNEMFVDVTETVNVMMRVKKSKKSQEMSSMQNFDSAFYSTQTAQSGTRLVPITGTVLGKVDFLSRITGVPELQILFNSARSFIEAPQFHRCIDLNAWRQSRMLSFIPPDGQSTLMTYSVDLDSLSEKTQRKMLGILEFDLQNNLGINKDEFELRISTSKHQTVSKIDTIHVQIYAHEPLMHEDDTEPVKTHITNGVDKMRVIRVTDGDFSYKGNGNGHWDIKNLPAGSQSALRVAIQASCNSSDPSSSPQESESLEDESNCKPQNHPVSPLWIKVSFAYKGQVPSGLKIDSLKLVSCKGLNDAVKPYKGVKYITETGDYTIRGH